jgi:inner membrane protein involved in colicin E2 resistance
MTTARLLAIALIYICASLAWGLLGGSVFARTGQFDRQLEQEVARLWGGHHVQAAPSAQIQRLAPSTEQVDERDETGRVVKRTVNRMVPTFSALPLDATRVDVRLSLDQRKKGLLWYDTYTVVLRGSWRVHNPDEEPRRVQVHFNFPSTTAIYDGFVFRVAGAAVPAISDLSRGADALVTVPPHGSVPIEVSYTSRGLGDWIYAFAGDGVAQVQDFDLTVHTDFDAIDFPAGTLSPTTRERDGTGWRLGWRFASLVSGQRIGMDLPDRLNPGPITARITWFAPVSLLFFITVLVILGVLRGQNLHPMNYAFLSAAFFAFHLLLAYLVDHLDLHVSFAIAAVTSVALVVTYLRLVAGTRFALLEAGLAQFVFLVLFSYAFFFEGYTGLTVTIGAIVTLFVLMQLTARVDWGAVFARRGERMPLSSEG